MKKTTSESDVCSPRIGPQETTTLGRVPSFGRSVSPSFLKDTQNALANAILDRQTAIVHAISYKHKHKKELNRHCHEMSEQVNYVIKVPGSEDESQSVAGCEEIKVETSNERSFTPCRFASLSRYEFRNFNSIESFEFLTFRM